MKPKDLQEKIEGPIFGLPTFFNDDYSVDHEGLARYVRFLIENGAKILLRTYGTSEFPSLSDDEIRDTTRTVVEVANGEAVVIGETGFWDTLRAAEFARWANDIGVDGLMVTYPYHGSYTTTGAAFAKAFTRHVTDIAAASPIPLLLHPKESMPMLSVDLYRQLVGIESVIACKDAYDDPYAQFEIIQALGDRMAIISGGSMRRSIQTYAHGGGTAYLTGVEGFKPELAFKFQAALEAGDLAEANHLAAKYEAPFLNKSIELGSWGAALKTGLALCGLPGGPMRPPAPDLTPEAQSELEKIMRESEFI